MKKIAIILLLFSCKLFAQTLDDIKKSDSIYFYFSSNEDQKRSICCINGFTKDTTTNYFYYKNNKEYLTLKYSKFEDFDAYDKGVETYKGIKKKRFLRKNKHKIITIDFLNKTALNLNELITLLERKKIFIIDEDEIKNRKILIRQVFTDMLKNTDDGVDDVRIFKTRNIIPFYFEMQLNDNFYTFLEPKIALGKKDIYILFKPLNLAVKDSFNYRIQRGDTYSKPKIQEQYTFKLNINKQAVFFQLTNKRNKDTVLEKKYDLFTKQHETISFEDLNNFSEKQLEILFSNTRNIYVVEDFLKNDYVVPKLIKITTEVNVFVEKNND